MKQIFQAIIRNPLHKIVALGLTVVLYAVLNEGKQQQRDILNVPVIVEGDSDVYVSDASSRAEVRLTVKGSERRLKNMEINGISGKVNVFRNIPGFDSGLVKIQLSEKHFSLPRGVEIKNIEPGVLVLAVQRRISRELPVNAVLQGQPGEGYECTGTRCAPSGVLVSGPEQIVGKLDSIETEPVMISPGENVAFSKNNVRLHNPVPGELTLNIAETEVFVEIKAKPIQKRIFKAIPITWMSPLQYRMQVTRIGENKVVVADNNVDVEISGPQNVVDKISAQDLVVVADLTSTEFSKDGEFQIGLQASLRGEPVGWVKARAIPGTIKVQIKLLD